jgi:serine/threonine protein phosphatase PrpC
VTGEGFAVRSGERTLTLAGGTQVGRRYHANFDVLYLTGEPPLAVVADGMGDTEGSAVAARTAVDVFVAELLTVDHTEAWLGAVYGWYPADSPQAAVDRFRLHRFVGHPEDPEPDVLNVALRPGDVLCVCSDGLAEQVPYQRLGQVLGSGGHPAEQVALLLADALDAGGRDNATLAVLRVD